MIKKKSWLLGAIALSIIILLTLVAAPNNSQNSRGSTYSLAPDGYGAWYAFMGERGTPVERWQKPWHELAKSYNQDNPATLLRIYSNLRSSSSLIFQSEKKHLTFSSEQNWVSKGNTLVLLGVKQPVTEAPFTTFHDSQFGEIKIATGRRFKESTSAIIEDKFGIIIGEKKIGKGKVIYATTPYLAANAYQYNQGNYQLLAQLVSQENQPILVDEYLHGYKDQEVIKTEQGGSVVAYFLNTPLASAFAQGLLVLVIVIWASNRRWGQPQNLPSPVIDNSQAYISALAGVLEKAGSSDFVVDVIGKEEQLQLQKALGLGNTLLESQIVVEQWSQQTGQPKSELAQLFQLSSRKRRLKETELLNWLSRWQKIRQLKQ